MAAFGSVARRSSMCGSVTWRSNNSNRRPQSWPPAAGSPWRRSIRQLNAVGRTRVSEASIGWAVRAWLEILRPEPSSIRTSSLTRLWSSSAMELGSSRPRSAKRTVRSPSSQAATVTGVVRDLESDDVVDLRPLAVDRAVLEQQRSFMRIAIGRTQEPVLRSQPAMQRPPPLRDEARTRRSTLGIRHGL